MNKTAIKNFAIWARNKLIADISYRAGLMGITVDGIHTALSQSTGQTEFYDIGTAEPYAITGEAIRQRRHLVELIQSKEKDTDYKTAYKYIIEEVAYTWFNRLIAVRFMEVNDYLPSHIRVLSSDTGKLEPDLVTTPFDAELEFTNAEQQTIIDLKNANKLDEVFRMLFIKQCNALNEILPALFEKTNDYTELLLNLSVIDQDGVVYHLVHDIPEEDFDVERGGQVEIIGWLYQYYNTEPKNEAFAKKGKITKEEVPAVTQLFTPDWIVRYMVENSLGRLWVEGHPNEDLKAGWKYYLEEAEQEAAVQEKLAARSILENNLYGLDIDDRAFQIAYFAVMMKARQYNRRILNGEYKPNLYSIQESNGINRNQVKYFGAGLNELEKNNAIAQMTDLLDAFNDAKEYGSILTIYPFDWDLLDRFVSNIEVFEQFSIESVGIDETTIELKQIIQQGKCLTNRYHIVTTNPPYLAVSDINPSLSKYIKTNYYDGKEDLYSVFVMLATNLSLPKGVVSFVTSYTWMFLRKFESFRKYVLSNYGIKSLVRPEYHSFFEEANVPLCSFVMLHYPIKYKGTYVDLNEFTGAEKQGPLLINAANTNCEYKYYFNQNDFDKIPGTPIAFWINNSTLQAFSNFKSLGSIADPKQGLATTDNEKYLRLWFEVPNTSIFFNATNTTEAMISGYKWFPYNKGGEYRRWFGNNYYIVNYSNDGYEIKQDVLRKYPYLKTPDFVVKNTDYYFREGFTWTTLTIGAFSGRYLTKGQVFDTKGSSCFASDRDTLLRLLAFVNSNVADTFLKVVSPTIDYNVGSIAKLPISERLSLLDVNQVEKCINITKSEWDSYELSWDFKMHPLVANHAGTLDESFARWENICIERFYILKEIEENLNKCISEIYGMESISSKVADRYISIRTADKKREVKSLISYAVGCMFGRFSLDEEGLIYAGGRWNKSSYTSFLPDEDNVIPLTDEEYLEDDIVSRLCVFLKAAFGEDTLEENLDYIAKALGNKGNSSRDIIRNYFLNDFFKDHCQTYSVTGSGKRPIYWLFDSGKQNGFKALIYLHRYNADTIGNLRIDYLHRMQRIYESEISRMQDMIDHSTNAREVGQATKRRDKLIKQLKECREYDEKLAHLALSRIELDLDDGVKVNYRKLQTANDGKFYEVLADSKNIMTKEK